MAPISSRKKHLILLILLFFSLLVLSRNSLILLIAQGINFFGFFRVRWLSHEDVPLFRVLSS